MSTCASWPDCDGGGRYCWNKCPDGTPYREEDEVNNITPREVQRAATVVRKELRACEEANMRGKRKEAYAAAERAQEAAFELKQLFALTNEEIAALAKEAGIELAKPGRPKEWISDKEYTFTDEGAGHGYQEAADIP